MAKAIAFVGVLLAVVLIFLFRYDYADEGFNQSRVDRLTGRYEFLCRGGWATFEECTDRSVSAASHREQARAVNEIYKQIQPQSATKLGMAAEIASEAGNKARCDYLLAKKAKGAAIYLWHDEHVPPWQREIPLPDWCTKLLNAPVTR